MSIKFVCTDSVELLRNKTNIGAVVTGMPDAGDMGWDLDFWERWYVDAAMVTMRATSPHAPTIFYCTDRKANGRLYSKVSLLLTAAERCESYGAPQRLLWHKIILRRGVGKTDLHRPGYTHLMAFSQQAGPGTTCPDVFDTGRSIYKNSIPLGAARFAVEFACSYEERLVDPFCGYGTFPWMAHLLGHRGIGIDIDPAQIARAEGLGDEKWLEPKAE